MTGTADTEAYEFQNIYGLETVVGHPHPPADGAHETPDRTSSIAGKYRAVVENRTDCQSAKGQPALVGTTSIEVLGIAQQRATMPPASRTGAQRQTARAVVPIVANAGARPGITIATNMAGRGTDIVLGGSLDAVLATLGEGTPKATSRARTNSGPARSGEGGRRPAHHRHRAPRVAHR